MFHKLPVGLSHQDTTPVYLIGPYISQVYFKVSPIEIHAFVHPSWTNSVSLIAILSRSSLSHRDRSISLDPISLSSLSHRDRSIPSDPIFPSLSHRDSTLSLSHRDPNRVSPIETGPSHRTISLSSLSYRDSTLQGLFLQDPTSID